MAFQWAVEWDWPCSGDTTVTLNVFPHLTSHLVHFTTSLRSSGVFLSNSSAAAAPSFFPGRREKKVCLSQSGFCAALRFSRLLQLKSLGVTNTWYIRRLKTLPKQSQEENVSDCPCCHRPLHLVQALERQQQPREVDLLLREQEVSRPDSQACSILERAVSSFISSCQQLHKYPSLHIWITAL